MVQIPFKARMFGFGPAKVKQLYFQSVLEILADPVIAS
jgi:hypothetical protein